jgi:hypothetical protein
VMILTCTLRNKQCCIEEYGIPKDVVFHPLVVVGRRLVGNYRCMVVRFPLRWKDTRRILAYPLHSRHLVQPPGNHPKV